MVRWAALLAVLAVLPGCSPRAPEPAPARRPVSVLLVTVDTLRADRLGCYGDAQARTPAVDRLAREGVLFERAYSPAPLTLPAHASLLTGLLPPTHGVRGNGAFALRPGPATLAEVLRADGRATAAFVGGFPLVRRFGLDRGFDHYDDALERLPGVHYEFAERRATTVVAAVQRWLAAHPEPAFVWVHLFDPHAPYDPPAEFRGPDPYRGEIAATDAALVPLLAAWDAREGPSLVALTADHGEAFGEHGEESHSLFVYDTTLRVPLVLRGEGLAAGKRVAAPVGLTDVGTTLVELAGGRGALPGRSLRGAIAGGGSPGGLYAESLAPHLEFGWSELRSWREGSFKYIRAPRPELYDVDVDPGETRDLAASRGEVVTRMEQALARASSDAGETQARRGPDPEAAERLRALGYVQGPGGRGSGADPKDKLEVARRIARAAGPFPDFATAARAYREIADLDPENPLVRFRLADALLRAGRAEEAVPHFRKVVDGGPRTADPFVGLATAYALLGRMEDARRVLLDALAVDPANGQVHFNLGEVARARGDVAEARRRYQAALADSTTRERASARLAGLP